MVNRKVDITNSINMYLLSCLLVDSLEDINRRVQVYNIYIDVICIKITHSTKKGVRCKRAI